MKISIESQSTHSQYAWPIGLALLLLAGCASDPIAYRVWPSVDPGKGGMPGRSGYPDHWRTDRPAPRDSVGLAFSGGGTMSASATVGALRGLRHLGLLDQVDYISSISGGTWGSLPYVFLDWEKAREVKSLEGIRSQKDLEDRYLGRYVPPGQLKTADLTETRQGSLESLVSNTKFSYPLLDLKGDENFAHMLNDTFLVPLGLGDDRRYVCGGEKQLTGILARNPSLSRDNFHLPGADKPFFIAGAALERRLRADPVHKIWASLWSRVSLSDAYFPVEATPVYTGLKGVSRPLPGLPGLFESPVGGFVETFGFDSAFEGWAIQNDTAIGTHRTEGVFTNRPPAFSLADMMAASGSAPAAFLGGLVDPLGLRPEFGMISGWEDDPAIHGREQPLVDGGSCDNTGIAALLGHGVTNIVAFINAAPVYDPHPEKRGNGADSKLTTGVSSLFGKAGIEGKQGPSAWRTFALANPETNHLLDNSGDRIGELEDAFDDLAKKGLPLVFCADYHTSQCRRSLERYGVEAGQPVRICWVYFTATKGNHAGEAKGDLWFRSLAEDARDVFSKHKRDLGSFPEVKVYFEHPPYIQQIPTIKANAITHYSAHNVVASAGEIRKAFEK